jgi:hypothetical protein
MYITLENKDFATRIVVALLAIERILRVGEVAAGGVVSRFTR